MDGVHDMGGMHGFGPLPIVANEPKFHAAWEGRVFAMNLATAVHTGANSDRFRFLMESMPPQLYLNSSYYQRWLHGLVQRCLENGLLTEAELAQIDAGTVADAGLTEMASPVSADSMRGLLMHNTPDVASATNHDFCPGDRVRGRNIHPQGHTRMPRYVRGKCGCVLADNGCQVFADEHGTSGESSLQTLYTVEFSATELWGAQAHPRDSVCLDLWAPHLEPA